MLQRSKNILPLTTDSNSTKELDEIDDFSIASIIRLAPECLLVTVNKR